MDDIGVNPYITPHFVQINGCGIKQFPFPNVFYGDKSLISNTDHPQQFHIGEDRRYREHRERLRSSTKINPNYSKKILANVMNDKMDINVNAKAANAKKKNLREEENISSPILRDFVNTAGANNTLFHKTFRRKMNSKDIHDVTRSPQVSLEKIRIDTSPRRSSLPKINVGRSSRRSSTTIKLSYGSPAHSTKQYVENQTTSVKRLKPSRKLSEFLTDRLDPSVTRLQKLLNDLFDWDKQSDGNQMVEFVQVKGLLIEIVQAKKIDKFEITTEEATKLEEILNKSLSSCVGVFSPLDDDLAKYGGNKYRFIEANKADVTIGLKCIETIIEIILDSKNEKRVLLEEVMENIILFLKNIFNEYFYPIARAEEERRRSRSRRSSRKPGLTDDLIDKLNEGEGMDLGPNRRFHTGLQTTLQNILRKICQLYQYSNLKEEFTNELIKITLDSFFVSNEIHSIQIRSTDILSFIFSTQHNKRTYIINEIIQNVLKLPKGKKCSRKYPLGDGDPKIQIFTFLILRLIQSCSGTGEVFSDEDELETTSTPVSSTQTTPVKHTPTGGDEGFRLQRTPGSANKDFYSNVGGGIFRSPTSFGLVREESMSEGVLYANYERAENSAKHFCVSLVNRVKGSTEDFRPILDNFVEDVLRCLETETWCSSADVLLMAMYRTVKDKFVRNLTMPDKWRSKGLDIMGMIVERCLRLLKKNQIPFSSAVALTPSTPSSPTDGLPLSPKTAKTKFVHHSFTKQKLKGYYGTLLTKGSISNFYQQFEESDLDEQPFRMVELMIHNKIAWNVGKMMDTGSYFSLHFSVLLWNAFVKEEEESENDEFLSRFYRSLWMKDPKTFRDALPRKIVRTAMIYLHSQSKKSIFSRVDEMTGMLFKFCGDTKTSVRQTSINCLKPILSVEPSLMRQKNFQNLIAGRFKDNSIKVRDSVLSLIDKFVTDNSEQYNTTFLGMFLETLNDDGKSVRRKAISILGRHYHFVDDDDLRVRICEALVSKLDKEDEPIRKLVYRNIKKIWIDPLINRRSSRRRLSMEDEDEEDDDDDFEDDEDPYRIAGDHPSGKVVREIVEVVSRKPLDFARIDVDLEQYWLTVLLKQFLNKSDSASVGKTLVNALIDHLVKLPLGGVESLKPVGKMSMTTTSQTLYAVVYCFPKCLKNKHWNRLETFVISGTDSILLKSEPQRPALMFINRLLLKMLPDVLFPVEKKKIMFVQGLANLIGDAKKFEVIESSVELFCMFHRLRMKNKLGLTRVFGHLYHQCFVQRARNKRAIITLGYFCRFFNFREFEKAKRKKPCEITNYNFPVMEMNKTKALEKLIYAKFCEEYQDNSNLIRSRKIPANSDKDVRVSLLEAFGSMLIRRPRLFLNSTFDSVISDALSSNVNTNGNLQIAVLKLFHKFLIKDQAANESQAHREDQTENSIGMSVIPKHINTILPLTYSRIKGIRYQVIQLLEVIVKNGLYVPSVIIPYTISLEGDIEAGISQRATALNEYLFDRFPSEFHANFPDGVEFYYNRMVKNSIASGMNGLMMGASPSKKRGKVTVLGITKVFRFTNKMKRRTRNSVYDQLIKQMKSNSIEYAEFILQLFLYADIVQKGCVLHIIHKIDTEMDKDTRDVEGDLRSVSKKVEEIEEKGDTEDIDISVSDAKKINYGVKISALLRLKLLLMEVYNIESTDLLSYNDNREQPSYKKKLKKYHVERELGIRDLLHMVRRNDVHKILELYQELYNSHCEKSSKVVGSNKRKRRSTRKRGRPATRRKSQQQQQKQQQVNPKKRRKKMSDEEMKNSNNNSIINNTSTPSQQNSVSSVSSNLPQNFTSQQPRTQNSQPSQPLVRSGANNQEKRGVKRKRGPSRVEEEEEEQGGSQPAMKKRKTD